MGWKCLSRKGFVGWCLQDNCSFTLGTGRKYRELIYVLFVMDGDERDCPSCAAIFHYYYNNSIMKRFNGDFCYSDARKVVFTSSSSPLFIVHLWMHDTAWMLAGSLGVFISFDNPIFINFLYLPKQNGINIRFSWCHHTGSRGRQKKNIVLFCPKVTCKLLNHYLSCRRMWCSGPGESCSRRNSLVRMKESRGWGQIDWPACKEVVCCWKNSSWSGSSSPLPLFCFQHSIRTCNDPTNCGLHAWVWRCLCPADLLKNILV